MKSVPFSVMALFCEDIREEKSGQFTIIGIMPDNLNLPTYPSVVPKLCIYVRVNYDPSTDPKSIKMRLIPTDGETLDLGGMEPEAIESAVQIARKSGRMSGLVLRTYLIGFPVNKPGVMQVEVDVRGETYLAGILNFVTE